MFKGYRKKNINISKSGWDTSKVTDMTGMFKESSVNKILPFTTTSSVENMTEMFHDAKNFNQSLKWDTSNVTNMTKMFQNAEKFNSEINFIFRDDLDAEFMFLGASNMKAPIIYFNYQNNEEIHILKKIAKDNGTNLFNESLDDTATSLSNDFAASGLNTLFIFIDYDYIKKFLETQRNINEQMKKINPLNGIGGRKQTKKKRKSSSIKKKRTKKRKKCRSKKRKNSRSNSKGTKR